MKCRNISNDWIQLQSCSKVSALLTQFRKEVFLMNELDNTFAEIAHIIEEARDNAYRKVNEELILMYQRVGRFLSEKSKEANYGDGYIDSLSELRPASISWH